MLILFKTYNLTSTQRGKDRTKRLILLNQLRLTPWVDEADKPAKPTRRLFEILTRRNPIAIQNLLKPRDTFISVKVNTLRLPSMVYRCAFLLLISDARNRLLDRGISSSTVWNNVLTNVLAGIFRVSRLTTNQLSNFRRETLT